MLKLIEPLVHGAVIRGLKVGARFTPFIWPKMFEGEGAAIRLCDLIVRKKHKRVLIVTSGTPVRKGLVQPLVTRLEAAGISVKIFDQVKPDPTIDQIEEAVDFLKQHKSDSILAIGGGSCLDAAKVIAARARNPRKSIKRMTGMMRVTFGMLPLYVIPLTAGTGSEVTIVAVVTDEKAKRKLPVVDLRLMPKAAALDGSLMVGISPEMTAATGMDALTHAVEAYLSKNALRRTDRLALEAVEIIMKELPGLVANGADVRARSAMARAAYLAGKAFTQSGVGYVHAISHNLGALYHMPHGRTNSIVMPYVLAYSLPECKRRLAKLAKVGGLPVKGLSQETAALAFISRIKEFNQQFGFPSKLDQLLPDDVPMIARYAREEARFTYAVPRYMSQKQCEGVLSELLVVAG